MMSGVLAEPQAALARRSRAPGCAENLGDQSWFVFARTCLAGASASASMRLCEARDDARGSAEIARGGTPVVPISMPARAVVD